MRLYVSHPNFPARLGSEGSGIIESLGSNENKWKIGDEVTIIPFLSYDKNGYWTSDSSNKYGLQPDAVTKILIKILNSKKPKARYKITIQTKIAQIMIKLLPTNTLDWFFKI